METKLKELAIPDHLLQCDFLMTFDHFDIFSARYTYKGKLLIKRNKPALKRMVKSFSLDLFEVLKRSVFNI